MQLNRAPSHFPVNRAALHSAEVGEHDELDEQAISVMAKAWAHPDDYELLKVGCDVDAQDDVDGKIRPCPCCRSAFVIWTSWLSCIQ